MLNKYDGFRIQTPNGTFIGFCNKDKFEWYLKKEIAERIDDKTIKLTFEPKITGVDKGFHEYYNSEYVIKCVVCGSNDDLNKFHVVPLEFRKYFPENVKSHACHDVVLLCSKCLDDANSLYYHYRQHLLDKYNISINKQSLKLRQLSTAYLGNNKKDKNIILIKIIELIGYEPTVEEIKNFTKMVCYDGIDDSLTIGEYIVKLYNEKDKLLKFEERWRQMFIDNLEPEFLPENW